MKPIQPVSVWFNGVEMQANRLNLYIVNDNLKDTAQFYYSLLVETPIPTTTTTTSEDPQPGPVPPPPGPLTTVVQVAQGNLTMTGQEYIDWDESTSGTINEAAFVWAAGKLNLTLE
jgi:hypothetical protein